MKKLISYLIIVLSISLASSLAKKTSQFTSDKQIMKHGLLHIVNLRQLSNRKASNWLRTSVGFDRFDGYTFREIKSKTNDNYSIGGNSLFLATDGVWRKKEFSQQIPL